MKINLEYIMKFNPCKEGVKEYIEAGHKDFNGSILEFLDLDGISASNKLWVVLREEVIPKNDLLELSCSFAESVLPIFENRYHDDRPRKAIEAKRKYIRGKISKSELSIAMDDARDAFWAARAANRTDLAAARAAADAAFWVAKAAAEDANANAAFWAARAAKAAAIEATEAAAAAEDANAAEAADAAAFWAADRAAAADAAEQEKQIEMIKDVLCKTSEKKLKY